MYHLRYSRTDFCTISHFLYFTFIPGFSGQFVIHILDFVKIYESKIKIIF